MQRSHKTLIYTLILAVLIGGGVWLINTQNTPDPIENEVSDNEETIQNVQTTVENLQIPWDIAFLPDGSQLVTEREGTLLSFDTDGTTHNIAVLEVSAQGEGGLLGIAVHPEFETNNSIYLYQTRTTAEGVENKVVRYELRDGALVNPQDIISGIPGARYHDGGRIAFGPDGYLYIATGDAGTESLAQDTSSLAGKILRTTDEGAIPEENPFGNAVYSYGHRNPQGLTWDSAGRLWSTEHGRSGIRSGFDEINLIQAGGNYGWPESQGDRVESGTIDPVMHSGSDTTWAPASAHYYNGSIFFGGLRGETLYEAVLSGTEVVELIEHFSGEFGRIRTVTQGPDGSLYITTSNRDGRGSPQEQDDRIIRIDPDQL